MLHVSVMNTERLNCVDSEFFEEHLQFKRNWESFMIRQGRKNNR